MNATDKAEALRMLDEVRDDAFAMAENACSGAAYSKQYVASFKESEAALRSLLSAEVSGIVSPDDPWSCPLPEHWRQAIVDYCYPSTIGDLPQRASDWIEQRARVLARKGVGNG